MPYIAICRDLAGQDNRRIRKAQLDSHCAYIETIIDRLMIAGPVGDAAGGESGISVFIYDVDHREDAERLLYGDPYFKAGLYGEIEIDRFLPAAGRWIGGKVW